MKIYFAVVIFLSTLIIGCKPQVDSLTERIMKVWTITVAREGNTVVFTNGATGNSRPGYANFKIELAQNNRVVFIDFDGVSCSGEWEVQGDNKLILKKLTPPPNNTNGVIEFIISDFSNSTMTLTRTSSSPKTGGTINIYQLTSK